MMCFGRHVDSGHFTIQDVICGEYSDDESNAVTPVKQNRTPSTRRSSGRASTIVGSQVTRPPLLVMFDRFECVLLLKKIKNNIKQI